MAMSVGELLALIRVDDSGFDRGVDRAERRLRSFQRDANGRLHDIKGRFVREGDNAGKGLSAGIGRGAQASIGALLGIGAVLGRWARIGVIGAVAAHSAVSILGLVSSLSALLGLAAGVPAAMVAGAGALAAFKIGLMGVADAIGGDEEALAKLAPQARAVVGEIRGLDGAWQRVKNTIQGAMFAPLRGEVTALAKTWLPILRTELGGVAAEFGLMGREAARAARDPGFVSSIGAGLLWLRQTLAANRGAVGDLVSALGTVVGTIAPILGVSGGVAELARRFREWVQQAAASGQLISMWQTALGVLSQLGGILRNLSGIVSGVMSAVKASGGDALGVLGDVLGLVNEFINSDVGQSTLITIFQTLGAVMAALKPAIMVVLGTLGTALSTLAPALGPLAGVLAQVLTAVSPLLPVVGQLAALVAGLLAQSLGNLLAVLGPVIESLAGALAPVLPLIADALGDVLTAVAPLAQVLGQFLAQALAQLLPPILQLIPMLIAGLVPAFMQLVPVAIQLFDEMQPLIPLVGDLLAAFIPLVPIITQLVVKIIDAFVPALTKVIPVLATLAERGIPNATRVIRVLVSVIGTVIGWVGQLIGWLGRLASAAFDMGVKAGRAFVELKDKILGALSGAGTWLRDAGRKIIDGLIGGIRNGFAKVKGTLNELTGMLPDWKGPRERDRKLLAPAGRLLMGGLMAGMRAEFPSIRDMLGGLTGRLAGMASGGGPRLSWGGAPAYAGSSSTTSTRNVTYDVRIYPQRVDFDADDLRHEQHKLAMRERADREW